MAKSLPKKAKSQPAHVCAPCGKDYGVWYRVDEMTREKLVDEMTREKLMGVGWYSGTWALPPSWVTGRCGVCQEVRSVTEPVVYGGLVEYWQPRLAFD